jgi:hypothetical protein
LRDRFAGEDLDVLIWGIGAELFSTPGKRIAWPAADSMLAILQFRRCRCVDVDLNCTYIPHTLGHFREAERRIRFPARREKVIYYFAAGGSATGFLTLFAESRRPAPSQPYVDLV